MPRHSKSNEHEWKYKFKETAVLTDCGLNFSFYKFYKTIETYKITAKSPWNHESKDSHPSVSEGDKLENP